MFSSFWQANAIPSVILIRFNSFWSIQNDNNTHCNVYDFLLPYKAWLLTFALLCRSYPLSGVDRHDCISPCFSVLCELGIELEVSQITLHSVHPLQFGPSSRSLPSHRHCCYMLCNVRIVSSQHMAIPRKAFLGDICGDWLDHCIAPELFIFL